MNKTILLAFITLFIVSCSSDDNSSCNCTGQWGTDTEIDFTENVEIDCNTREPIYNSDNEWLGNGNMPWHWLGCQE